MQLNVPAKFIIPQPEKYSLCFASVLDDSLRMGHQSWVHLLPVADIVEHTVSYTWALQGLCLRSKSTYSE